ncbi:GatB/YqeY domain-containing protein [Candidatus Sumerlaeota bacterium]|nr:GatB/YqeY domain-containing protein [Candidatus Sumerlaeota bacterium]
MSIAERIRADLKASMIARNEGRTSALRMIQAELLKKEKEKVGTVLDDDTVKAILTASAKQRRDSIESFRSAGNDALAAKEEAELAIIMEFLPAALTEAEVEAEIDKAIATSGASSAKDIGKVMGGLMKALKATGKPFDSSTLQNRVRGKLGG